MMIIDDAFDHFMKAYWNEMWDEFYRDLSDAVESFFNNEGSILSKKLKNQVSILLNSGYFRDSYHEDKRFVEKYRHSCYLTVPDANLIIHRLDDLLKNHG